MTAVMEPKRSLVSSQWNKITFYGKRRNVQDESTALDVILNDTDEITAIGENQLVLNNGAKVVPLGKREAKPSVTQKRGNRKEVSSDPASEPMFQFKGLKFTATGRLTAEGFVVFAGSTVNDITESFKKETCYYPLRLKLEADGSIIAGVFAKDVVFKSAQFAASVVSSRAACAPKDWKTEDGRCYGEIHPKNQKPMTAAKAMQLTKRKRSKAKDEIKDFLSLPKHEVWEDGTHIERYVSESNGTVKYIEHRW